jgi:hypothetical protein
MATAVLSGRVDTHGYGLPFGWHNGNKCLVCIHRARSVRGSRTWARNRCTGSWPRWSLQDRHGRAAWQLRLREGKAPLLQRIEVQGNSIKGLCQEAKDCAGACCEQKRLLIEIHKGGAMAGVRSQLVSLEEAQLSELKSQLGAAQSQNANLERENLKAPPRTPRQPIVGHIKKVCPSGRLIAPIGLLRRAWLQPRQKVCL